MYGVGRSSFSDFEVSLARSAYSSSKDFAVYDVDEFSVGFVV